MLPQYGLKINIIFLQKDKHNITCTALHYDIACSAKIATVLVSHYFKPLIVAPLAHCLAYGTVNKHVD